MTKDSSDRTTEQLNDRFAGMDQWPAEQLIRAILAEQIQTAEALRRSVPLIAQAADEAASRLKDSAGRLVYIGAGTAARLGVQDGTELTPTFGWPPERLAFVIAGGQEALFKAIEGAEDNVAAARRDIQALGLTKDDVCIAVSASGTTPFTLTALQTAVGSGAVTIAISSNQDSPLLQAATYPLYLASGAEPIGGSTRMNAGTAQKIVLNMISTAIMVRLNHVYDGMMVDVRLTSEKLRQRAKYMVTAITGCTEEQAVQALKASGAGREANVKLAALIAKGCEPGEGRALLEQCEGNLRAALDHVNRK